MKAPISFDRVVDKMIVPGRAIDACASPDDICSACGKAYPEHANFEGGAHLCISCLWEYSQGNIELHEKTCGECTNFLTNRYKVNGACWADSNKHRDIANCSPACADFVGDDLQEQEEIKTPKKTCGDCVNFLRSPYFFAGMCRHGHDKDLNFDLGEELSRDTPACEDFAEMGERLKEKMG